MKSHLQFIEQVRVADRRQNRNISRGFLQHQLCKHQLFRQKFNLIMQTSIILSKIQLIVNMYLLFLQDFFFKNAYIAEWC